MTFLRHVLPVLLVSVLLLTTSCRGREENPAPVGGGILVPFTETTNENGENGDDGRIVEQTVLPLVNPGQDYNILAIYDGNLDLEQSDEQVLVAIPLNDEDAPLELMIASTNPIRNEYDIVWRRSLSTRTLTGITLRADDLTGNGRNDLIVAGFDANGRHVTDVFAVAKNANIDGFSRVFSLTVEGNIDVVSVDRSAGYFSGLSAGTPYSIIVQRHDPSSDNELDLVETEWNWNSRQFSYLQGESRLVRAETILEERIGEVYAGDVDVYENFLKGAWYRESGERAFEDMVYFNPLTREIMFYDGSIQEIFIWGTSHRTTAKRLYTRVNNAVIPSINDTFSVSAESWDRISLERTRSKDWVGFYRRLNPSLQSVLDSQMALDTLLSPNTFTGVWRGHGDQEIIFDLPRVEWVSGSKRRLGTASVFSIGRSMVLQIQFLKENGAIKETVNWTASYEEDSDETRIIRSLTLAPAILDADGVRSVGSEFQRFEQIEVVSASD